MTRPRPPLLTRDFVLAALAHLSFGLALFLFLHFPGFLKEQGAGEAQIGRIMALNAISAMICGPLVGRLLDVYGRRSVILWGAALYSIAVGLYLSIDGIGPRVYAIRLLDGIGSIAIYAGLFTFASDHVAESRRTEGLALFGASGLLPMALSGLLGDAILATAGYHTLFSIALGFAVVAFALCLMLRDADFVREKTEASSGLRGPLNQTDLHPMWFVSFCFFFSTVAVFTFLKTLTMKTGVGTVGGFFTVYASVAIGLRLFFGWLPDRVGQRRVLGPALLAYAAGLSALGEAQTPTGFAVAALLCGGGHGFAFPVLFSMVINRARRADRGSAMGIYTTVDWIGHLAGPPLIGLMIEASGYPSTLLGLGIGLSCAVAVFYLWDARTLRAIAGEA